LSGACPGLDLTVVGDGLVEDSLDVVAVGINDERREVMTAVLRPQPRRAVVRPAVTNCSAVPTLHGVFGRRDECDVRPGGHSISTRFAADRVQAEVVTLAAAEQDVCIPLELAFAQHGEAKFSECSFIHSTARRQIADPDAYVVDDVAHGR